VRAVASGSRVPAGAILGLALMLAMAGIAWSAVMAREAPGQFSLPPGAAPTAVAKSTPAALPTPILPAGPVSARVGLQVGHWRSEELPDELAVLREQRGGVGGGVAEVSVTLPVVREVSNLLAARGVTVDILPATVPPGYRADLFLAVHCDVNNDPAMRGYKLARSWNSPVAALDDQFIATLGARYAAATGLPRDPLITRAMSGYYAFNSEDYRHAITAGTPAAIVELGFLTNVEDRQLLVSRPDLVAAALADGILRFLTRGA
jgi:hypothetical protein